MNNNFRTLFILSIMLLLSIRAHATIIEVVIFHTEAGISDEQVIKLGKQALPAIESAPGFIKRILSKGKKKHEWMDMVYWKNLSMAEAAAIEIIEKPAIKPFIAIMKDYKLYHFKPIP